jgi:cardiolipin-specific phospholipase
MSRNFEGLSSVPGTKVYALDLLGMGNSSRPPFRIRSRDPDEKIEEAEAFFIDAFEEWRKEKKIEKMTLLGHSLGGYLSVNYCLKYPSHVDRLILVSPVGVPHNPYETQNDIEKDPSIGSPPETTVQREFSDPQTMASRAVKIPQPLPRWITVLWEANFSPFIFVRLPVLGPKFASRWTTRRFGQLPTLEEQAALHQYAYQIFRLKGSGEFALAYLLAPGAYARRPLLDRIKGLQYDGVLKRVTWIYGSNDWMDVDAGRDASENLSGIDSEVFVVDRAGHNVHLDNPDGFNEIIYKELGA